MESIQVTSVDEAGVPTYLETTKGYMTVNPKEGKKFQKRETIIIVVDSWSRNVGEYYVTQTHR